MIPFFVVTYGTLFPESCLSFLKHIPLLPLLLSLGFIGFIVVNHDEQLVLPLSQAHGRSVALQTCDRLEEILKMAVPAEIGEILGNSLTFSSPYLLIEGLFLIPDFGLLRLPLILLSFDIELVKFISGGPVLSKGLDLLVDQLGLHEEGIKFFSIDVHRFVYIFKMI